MKIDVKNLDKEQKKLIAIAGVAVFVLIGLGMGISALLFGGEEPKEEVVEYLDEEHPQDGKVRAKALNEDGVEVDVVIGTTEDGELEEGFYLDPIVVDIGELMIPVRTPTSISYIIVQIGIGMDDPRKAEFLRNDVIAARVKNEIVEIMLKMAEYNLFSGEKIDTDYASYALQKKLAEKYEYVDDVLFLSFVKQEIGR